MTRPQGKAVALACVTLVILMAGCRKDAPDDVLLRGYAFGKADQWNSARPFVQEYLLDHPADPGAHFLWGQCHLHGPDPSLEIARGEFSVTLFLLAQNDHSGLLNADLDTKKLTIMAHQEMARACFRQIYFLSEHHESAETLRTIASEALRHVEKGLTLAPDVKELQDMRAELNRQLGQDAPAPAPAREPDPSKPRHLPSTPRGAIAV